MKKSLRFLFLTATLLLPLAATSQTTQTLTVANGTATHMRLPVYGLYTDVPQQGQTVYPASMLENASDEVSMVGATITSLTYYLQTTATVAWTTTFTVKIMEVPGNGTISGFANTASLGTTVYAGTLDATQSTMTVNFTTPYVYGGGNLLVEFRTSTGGNFSHAIFYGANQTHTSSWMATNNTEGDGAQFIPKTTFTFTSGAAISCHAVQNLEAGNITDSTITLNWNNPNNTGATYTVYNGADSAVVATGLTATSYTVTGLTPNTGYRFIVEANCSATEASLWRTIEVATLCSSFDYPYSTTFEEMNHNEGPRCWEVLGGSCYVHEQTPNAYRGDQFLHFQGSTHNLVVMPIMNGSLNGKQVRFMTRPESGSYSACGSLSVGYITNIADTTSFVPLQTYPVTLWGNEFQHEYFEEIVEFDSVPEGARVAFCQNAVYDNYYWFVDNVVLEVQPSCHRPVNFAVADATDTSLTLSWTDTINSGATYTLYNYYDSTIVATGIAGNSYTITGLTPNTLYSYSLTASCSPTEESMWAAIDARTACGIFTVPYVEGFENEPVGEHPACWEHMNHLSSYANVCNVVQSIPYEGNHSLRFEYSLSTGNVVALPEFSTATNLLRLRFMQRAEMLNANCGNLQVGYLTDAADATSFVPLRTLDRDDSYSRVIVNFDSAPDSARIALRHVATGLNYYWFVDDLHVELIPACRDIDEVYVDGFSANSVTVRWTNTNASAYLVEARQDSSVVSTATVSGDTVATLTGLSLNQDYDIYVRGLCGNDSSMWSEAITAHIGYCIPEPTYIDGQGITNVTFGYDEVADCSLRPSASPYYGDYTSYVGDLPVSMPVDVAITFRTGVTYGTIVWIDLNNNMVFEDDEIVFTGMGSNENPSVLHAIFTLDADQDTGYYRMRIGAADSYFDNFISSGSGSHSPCELGITYADRYGLFHDYTVHIVPAPACLPVTDIAVSDITATGATISWNHLGVSSFSIYNGSTPLATGIDSTHFTLTGLTPATYYNLSLVANCIAGDDAMEVPFGFATRCDGALSLPFVETFDPTSGTRDCWDISSNNAENYWEANNGMAFYERNGHNVLRFSSVNLAANDNYTQYAYSPSFSVGDADALRIAIHYSTYTTTDNLFFGYTTATGTVWDDNAYSTVGGDDTATYVIYIPPVATSVVIRYEGQWRYYAYVDEVSVTAAAVHRVTLESSDASYGTVGPEGTTLVPVGGSFTATATATEGYHFAGWYDGTTLMSAANPYAFIPTADITLTALFEADIVYYTVSVNCDTTKGTVSGDGSYEENSQVTLTATPKEGYSFAGWLDGTDIIDANPYTFTLTADRSLIVLFHTVGIDEVDASALALYPNPATTTVTLQGLAAGSRVELLGINGRLCGEWKATDGELLLDLGGCAKGAYFVRVVSASNTAVRKLIVK